MHRMFAAALLSLPLVPAEAAAQSWYRVGGNEHTQSYVDLASLRPMGGKIIGDVESVYAEPLDGGVWAARIRTEFDCTGKYFRTLEYSYYGQAGKLLSTEPSETINDRKIPKPDSINEAIMDFVCFRKGGTLVADPFADAPTQF